MLRVAVRLSLVVALLVAALVAGQTQPQVTGVVRGAESLYVRRGPGTEYPAFETLAKGTEVPVEAVENSWVLVRLPDGSKGYVHGTFLELRGTLPPATIAAAAPTIHVSQRPTSTATPERAVVSPTPGAAEPKPPSRAAAPEAPARPQASSTSLAADVRRLLRLTQEMHGEIVGRQNPGNLPAADVPGRSSSAPGVASTLALSGVGLMIGFLIGSAYGRRQERGRRTRVRF